MSYPAEAGKKNWLPERIIKGSPPPETGPLAVSRKPRKIIPREFVRINDLIYEAGSFQLDNISRSQDLCDSPHVRLTKVSRPADGKGNPDGNMTLKQIIEDKEREFKARLQSEKEQAFRNGFENGKAASLSEKLTEVERVEMAFGIVAHELTSQRDEYLKNAESIIAKLSLQLAGAIIKDATSKISGEVLQNNLNKCLETLKGAGKVKVMVNPIDYDFARDNTTIIEQFDKGNFYFEFEPDQSISPGGCYLETANGTVDGRIESQFEILRNNFLQLI